MNRPKTIFLLLLAFPITLSAQKNSQKTVVIKNDLAFSRTEVVAIPITQLGSLLKKSKPEQWVVNDGERSLITQLIDTNGDTIPDEFLFQISLAPKEKKTVHIKISDKPFNSAASAKTYARFAPERIDDYAWENDLVAFRTYGPEAQRLVDDGEKGGTLSSGIDCWLKRVNYPVVDKWYKKYVEGGSYHKDDGEGYDPYHVGISRGCGGIGVWKNDSLYVSRNFVSYKKIADGPLRTVFELNYAPWRVDNAIIHETKRVTIELGSQLFKMEEMITSTAEIPNVTVGITLHDKKGQTHAEAQKGFFSYWEPVDDSELGTGVVAEPAFISMHRDFRTEKKDLSHLYIVLQPQKKVIYYAGFGWKKAGVFNTHADWNNYLDMFSKRLASPVNVFAK
jgi:hypothetical protein